MNAASAGMEMLQKNWEYSPAFRAILNPVCFSFLIVALQKEVMAGMIDLFKCRSITTFFTSLVSATFQSNTSGEIGVSSLIDTWLIVRMAEDDECKKRTREVFIVKSRGTNHDSDVHKFILSDDGIFLLPYAESAFSGNQKKNFDKNVAEDKKNK